jgi:hypothetical protein
MQKLIGVLLCFFLFLTTISTGLTAAAPISFGSAQEAQQRCPSDTVVWLNPPSGIALAAPMILLAVTASGISTAPAAAIITAAPVITGTSVITATSVIIAAVVITTTPAPSGHHHTGGDRQQRKGESKQQS